jgi:hypothetical protein
VFKYKPAIRNFAAHPSPTPKRSTKVPRDQPKSHAINQSPTRSTKVPRDQPKSHAINQSPTRPKPNSRAISANPQRGSKDQCRVRFGRRLSWAFRMASTFFSISAWESSKKLFISGLVSLFGRGFSKIIVPKPT